MIPTLQIGQLGRRLISSAPIPGNAAAHASRSSAQTIASGADEAMSFDTETRDDGALWASGSPTRMTVPDTGWYVVYATLRWDSYGGTDSPRRLYLRVDGSKIIGEQSTETTTASIAQRRCVAAVEYLTAGQYVEAMARHQRSPSGLNIAAATAQIGICRIATSVAARVRRAAAQSVTNTYISFDTEERDDGAMFDSGSPQQLLVPSGEGGWYVVCGSVKLASAAGSNGHRARLFVNNSAQIGRSSTRWGATWAPSCYAASVYYMAAGDYFSLRADQSSGSAKDTEADGCFLAAAKIDTTIAAHVSRSSTQSISTGGSGSAIQFDTEDRDDGAVYDSGSNTRLTVPTGGDGWYAIAGFVHWAANTSGTRMTKIVVDGGTIIANNEQISGSSHDDPANQTTAVYYLTAGQYVELLAYHTAASSLNVQAGTKFSMARLEFN